MNIVFSILLSFTLSILVACGSSDDGQPEGAGSAAETSSTNSSGTQQAEGQNDQNSEEIGESASNDETSQASGDEDVDEEQQIDGLALYDTNCSGCHGSVSSSPKRGSSSSSISNSINNIPSMMHLSFLTSDEIDAISEALAD